MWECVSQDSFGDKGLETQLKPTYAKRGTCWKAHIEKGEGQVVSGVTGTRHLNPTRFFFSESLNPASLYVVNFFFLGKNI